VIGIATDGQRRLDDQRPVGHEGPRLPRRDEESVRSRDVYINYVSAPKGRLYWRKLSDINTEHELPISDLTDGNSRRWVPGTHKILFQGHDPNDRAGPARSGIHLRHRHRHPEQLDLQPKGVLGG
jgi:hypothetical protein